MPRCELEVENWRWAGVPFFIRTGKQLAATETELRLVFRHPPKLQFVDGAIAGRSRARSWSGSIRSTGVRIVLDAQRADKRARRRSTLDMEFAQEGGEGATPYEVLLHAALVGDSTHFTRQDAVEESWRVCSRCSTRRHRSSAYDKGSWGPEEANKLVVHYGGWREPWQSS